MLHTETQDLFFFCFFLEGVHHTPLKYTHKFAHSEAPTYTLSLLASTASAPRHPARRRQLSRPRRSAGITSRQASARLYAAGRRGGPARSPRAAAGVAGDEMPACSEADRWPDLPRAAGFRRPEGWIFDSWGEWWWRGGGGGVTGFLLPGERLGTRLSVSPFFFFFGFLSPPLRSCMQMGLEFGGEIGTWLPGFDLAPWFRTQNWRRWS